MDNQLITHFFPGDQWVYIEVAANWQILDDIISNDWPIVINEMTKYKLIRNAYFIRYFHRLPHLRMRFQLSSTIDTSYVIDVFKKVLSFRIENKQIWNIRIETYKREYLRYHKELIEETESLFCMDSMINARIVSICRKYMSDKKRIVASVILVDYYLDNFAYTLPQKHALLHEMALSYKSRYKFNEYNSKQFNRKYREYKSSISDALCDSPEDLFVLDVREILISYSGDFKTITNLLLNGIEMYQFDKNELLMSYIHMMFNRLFVVRNQIYELLIYDFMSRYYLGLLAQNLST